MEKFSPPWLEDRLRRISSLLIDAHRSDDRAVIEHYARRVPDMEKGSPKRQFMRLIQVFHPDRLAVYVRQVDSYRVEGNELALQLLDSLLSYESFEPAPARSKSREARGGSRENSERYRFDESDFGESYGYDEDEFGYGEEDFDDSDLDGADDDFEEVDPYAEGSFMDALKREFFGNLDLYPSRYELGELEGELDISDYGIRDLSGAEYCRNVSSLNLAMNQIDNVWPLRGLARLDFLDLSSNALESADDLASLTGLQELDLSFNEIDDVAFLLELPALKCVSLVGNPIANRGVLAKLRARGVVVVI